MKYPIHDAVKKSVESGLVPTLTVYNRVDGPGSSLDLRLFQQAFWQLKNIPSDPQADPTFSWSKGLPRTVGMSITIGTDIEVYPISPGKIVVESIDFGFSYTYNVGVVPPTKENWLLKIMDTFGLDGVKFVIRNQRPELKSAGLGGSAAVTTGVCLMADMLTGKKFTKTQLIGMASMMEHDMGVSITGTQEQSAAMYGGIRDYVWFPYGVPGKNDFFGSSIQQEILFPKEYAELRKRMDIYFTAERHSSDVNAVWEHQMRMVNGFLLHKKKNNLAYEFREALRLKEWNKIAAPVEEYRKIRTQLCTNYMSEHHRLLHRIVSDYHAVCFPLGGGGGSVMVFSPDPEQLKRIKKELEQDFIYLDYEFSENGHEFINFEIIDKELA